MGCCKSYKKRKAPQIEIIIDDSVQGHVDKYEVNVKEEEKQNQVKFFFIKIKCLKKI